MLMNNCHFDDLSFNMLAGQIPGALQSLDAIDDMFLTNNSLSGAVPSWVLNSNKFLDVSYNKFSKSSPASSCLQTTVNIVFGYSSMDSKSINWCLRKGLPCPGKLQHHFLFIDCGGIGMEIDGNDYAEDLTTKGSSSFISGSGTKWTYSSTGLYMNNDNANFVTRNPFSLNVTGAKYYQTACLAPTSLKYYGLCLQTGSYTVLFHFVEIMYSNQTSLGKRIFDVAIQGNVVLKDFNTMEEAKGVGKCITMNFSDVRVDGSTLEIDLYWAGKGTTAILDRGVYEPLISAITVTPNFKVDTGGGLSLGTIIGIVAGSCLVPVLILVILRMTGFLGGKDLENEGPFIRWHQNCSKTAFF